MRLEKKNIIFSLVLGHVFLILLSNVLVQYPFQIFGMATTWGAFSYPGIFILTDLTTRLCGANLARRVVLLSMLPGLVLSYLVSSYFTAASVWAWNILPLRIAGACLLAYVLGQLLDISVFQRLRSQSNWWLAPAVSSFFGNVLDTLVFFSSAFYNCDNEYLRSHWLQIAQVDLVFKILISLIAFVPVYGMLLSKLLTKSQPSVGIRVWFGN